MSSKRLKTQNNTPWRARKSATETMKAVTVCGKKRQITQLTSIMVHCSTTIASYVGVTTFGSLSVASWKMKTLSTDLGSSSTEREREKTPSFKITVNWAEHVHPAPPAEIRHSHKSLYYTASTGGHLYLQWALMHNARRRGRRQERSS